MDEKPTLIKEGELKDLGLKFRESYHWVKGNEDSSSEPERACNPRRIIVVPVPNSGNRAIAAHVRYRVDCEHDFTMVENHNDCDCYKDENRMWRVESYYIP